MYKQIEIKNYGPYKNESINLINGSHPIHIIGMNDVGKTALLHSIKSASTGLNKKYGKDGEVKITIEIMNEHYAPNLKKRIKNNFEHLFLGTASSIIKNSEMKLDVNIFESNENIKKYISEITSKINTFLTSQNKIEEIITDKTLNEIKEAIKNKKTRYKNDDMAIHLIDILIDFKKFVYSKFYDNVIFMSADSNDHFDYIKPSYILNDTTNDEGHIVKSDFKDINLFLKSFLSSEEIENFKEIIFKDDTQESKRESLRIYEDKINDKFTRFFNKYFPSQNKDLKFSFEVLIDSNKIIILIKDSTSKKYTSLGNRSDGFKWFLKLFILIKSIKKNSLVLIDEPEKFLHASAQKELVLLFEKLKIEKQLQIIYATHSPFMLNKDIFPSLKIIVKKDNGSKIYNNINEFINSNEKKIKDVLLPITMAMGINILELAKLNNIRKYLFVEGEADIYSIKLAALLSDSKIPDDIFLVPLAGDKNPYTIYVAKMIELNYFILLDGIKRPVDLVDENDKDKISFLQNIMNDEKILDPENLISEKIWKKYNINQFDSEKNKNIPNHKVGWKNLLDDEINKKSELEDIDKSNLKKYWKAVNEILK